MLYRKHCSIDTAWNAALVAALAATIATPLAAGPYSAAGLDPTNAFDPGIPGYTGPDGDGIVSPSNAVNPIFAAWASEILEYAPTPGVTSEFNNPLLALGPVTGDQLDVVSLGDLNATQIGLGVPPGRLDVAFGGIISNGPGPDFAVFENAFIAAGDSKILGELAYVEVSSDGVNFARFHADSRTPSPVGPFGVIDATDILNLVGKHINNKDAGGGLSIGTPFNLDDLIADPLVIAGLVDLGHVRYVRIVDIPGDGTWRDAQNDPIHDAWPTVGSGGVDIDAIGAIHFTPTSDASGWSLYP